MWFLFLQEGMLEMASYLFKKEKDFNIEGRSYCLYRQVLSYGMVNR